MECRNPVWIVTGLRRNSGAAAPGLYGCPPHVSGTRLQIRVRENETAGGIPLREETPRNLVAETAGTVVSILVRAGKAAVQPGDEVEKGQVLVEGMVPVTDDSGGGGPDTVCAGRCRYPSADNKDLPGAGFAIPESAQLYRKETAGRSPADWKYGHSGNASVNRKTKLGTDWSFQADSVV